MIQLVLLAVGFIVAQRLVQQTFPNSPAHMNSIRALIIVLVLLVTFNFINDTFFENFLFQVSPSKTVNCCPKGFYGMPVEFHYEGDNTRFKNCSMQENRQMYPVQTSSYRLLGDTYQNDIMESFGYNADHRGINPQNYDNMRTAYRGDGRFEEEFCSSCTG